MSNNTQAHIIKRPYILRRFFTIASEKNAWEAFCETGRFLVDRPLHRLRNATDALRDVRACGMSLERSVTSPYGKSHGAVDSIHSPYGSLEEILGCERFVSSDVFLDVGCGKGRPLAYLAGRGFPGRLYGVELNPEVAQVAQNWARNFDNVEIYSGDVFDIDLPYVTHYFMFIPMTPQFSRRLIAKIEAQSLRKVRLYYLCDLQDGEYIDARPGWALVRRGWIHRRHGIPLHGSPQRYSVWDFNPYTPLRVLGSA